MIHARWSRATQPQGSQYELFSRAPLRALRANNRAGQELDQYVAARFAPGAWKSGVVLGWDKVGRIGARGSDKLFRGLGRRWYGAWNKPFFFGDKLQAQMLEPKIAEMQTAEMVALQVRNAARIFRIPPIMLGEDSGSLAAAGVEQMSRLFWSSAKSFIYRVLAPLSTRLLNRGEQFTIDESAFVRGDADGTARLLTAVAQGARMMGVEPDLNRNERRHMLGASPDDELGRGDEPEREMPPKPDGIEPPRSGSSRDCATVLRNVLGWPLMAEKFSIPLAETLSLSGLVSTEARSRFDAMNDAASERFKAFSASPNVLRYAGPFIPESEEMAAEAMEKGAQTASAASTRLVLENADGGDLVALIHSEGGLFTEFLAMKHLIDKYLEVNNASLTTISLGATYSAGAFMFMLGSKRILHPLSSLMFHKIQGGKFGDEDAHMTAATGIKKHNDEMVAWVAGRSKMSEEDYRANISPSGAEWYPTTEEAMALGIGTELMKEDGSKETAAVDEPVAESGDDFSLEAHALLTLLGHARRPSNITIER